jgi:hypothetical protein
MHGWGAVDGSSIAHRFTDPGMSVPPEERESESSPVFRVAPTALLRSPPPSAKTRMGWPFHR